MNIFYKITNPRRVRSNTLPIKILTKGFFAVKNIRDYGLEECLRYDYGHVQVVVSYGLVFMRIFYKCGGGFT